MEGDAPPSPRMRRIRVCSQPFHGPEKRANIRGDDGSIALQMRKYGPNDGRLRLETDVSPFPSPPSIDAYGREKIDCPLQNEIFGFGDWRFAGFLGFISVDLRIRARD